MAEGKSYYLYDHQRGVFLEIREGTICGREGDIRFDNDDLVSRQHFRVSLRGDEVLIKDLNSTNPPHVNSAPMSSSQERRVWVGDLIQIGAQRLTLTDQDRVPPALPFITSHTRRMYKLVSVEQDFLADRVVFRVLDRIGALFGIRALRVHPTPTQEESRRLTGVFVFILIALFAGAWTFKHFVPNSATAVSARFAFDCQRNPSLPYCATTPAASKADRAVSSQKKAKSQ